RRGRSAARRPALARLRNAGRGGLRSRDRPAAGRAAGRSLEIDGQPALEELVVAARDAPPPDELQAALLGEDPQPGRDPPQTRRGIPAGPAAQGERLLEQELSAQRRAVLDVVEIGEVGLVVEGDVPVGVATPGETRGRGRGKEGNLLQGEI